jgi:hypothetical protein
MGLSDKTTASIQRAISAEAEALLSGADRQAKSVVAIKEQQERIKEMKVRLVALQENGWRRCRRVGRHGVGAEAGNPS